MAFIPADRVCQISINQRLHGQQVQNTLYAQRQAGWDPASLELLAGEMITWVGTVLYVRLSLDLSLTEVQCRDISVADGPQFIGTPSVPVLGLGAGAALPGNVAACVSFRSGLAGRSRRGRNYVAGIQEADATGNTLAQVLGTALFDAYDFLLDGAGPFGVTQCAWVIVSRFANKQPRAQALVTGVNSVLVDAFVDSQRRRLTGRGV